VGARLPNKKHTQKGLFVLARLPNKKDTQKGLFPWVSQSMPQHTPLGAKTCDLVRCARYSFSTGGTTARRNCDVSSSHTSDIMASNNPKHHCKKQRNDNNNDNSNKRGYADEATTQAALPLDHTFFKFDEWPQTYQTYGNYMSNSVMPGRGLFATR